MKTPLSQYDGARPKICSFLDGSFSFKKKNLVTFFICVCPIPIYFPHPYLFSYNLMLCLFLKDAFIFF